MAGRRVTVSRYAKDDRRGNPTKSPFRSHAEDTRIQAALAMVAKRRHEIAGLEKILAETTEIRRQRIVSQRLRASRANLQSWLDYLDEPEREPRAVITPAV